MKTALFPGSFDPVTTGHLQLIRRAAGLFEKVYVVILHNPEKISRFSVEIRLKMLKAVTSDIQNVVVDVFDGFTADYAKKMNISCLIRGIRNADDYAYEAEMAAFNRRRTGIETLWFPAPEEYARVSSTAIRQALEAGKTPPDVPPEILPYLTGENG